MKGSVRKCGTVEDMPVSANAVMGIAHLVLRCVCLVHILTILLLTIIPNVYLNLSSDRCVTGSSVVGITSVQLLATGLI